MRPPRRSPRPRRRSEAAASLLPSLSPPPEDELTVLISLHMLFALRQEVHYKARPSAAEGLALTAVTHLSETSPSAA